MIRDQQGNRSETLNVSVTSWVCTSSPAPIAIHCDAQSTIVGALAHDAAESTWVLQPGTTPYSFKSINSSSTTKTGIKLIFGQ